MHKNIVYMGTPHYAEEILRGLIEAEDLDVRLVITQPDKRIGRRRVLTSPPVKLLAQEHGIEVLQPVKLSDDGIKERIIKSKPDFIVVAAFGQLLPVDILSIAPCINLHASLLPQYRGASPIQQALLHGDGMTGVTSMLMDEGLDTGAILDMVKFEIPSDMRLSGLTDRLTRDAVGLTLHTLRYFDQITPKPQDDKKATYCKKIQKQDGEIDYSDAGLVYDKYRAFEGWPGVFDPQGVKLEGVELVEREGSYRPSEILEIEDQAIRVGCSKGSIRVGMMQPPSKKMVDAKSYCAGRRLKVGDIIF